MYNGYTCNETGTFRIPKDKGLNSAEIKNRVPIATCNQSSLFLGFWQMMWANSVPSQKCLNQTMNSHVM